MSNPKVELKGKLEAFERNRQNRFEPAIRFILAAKDATILLSQGKPEEKRDFLKKSVRTSNWRINRWRWSSKNRGIYWPNSIPHQLQNTSPATKFRQKKTGGERGIRTPHFPTDNKGNPHDDAQIDSQFPVASSPDLSQVVTAWEKLPAPFKAAILAIVKSAA